MVKNEIMAFEMLENLVGLSEKSFVQFVTYVEDIDEMKKIKVFLNILVKIASEKRKKTIRSASKALELSLNKKVSCNESIRYSEEKINRIGEKNMNNSGIVEQKYIDSREVAEMIGKEHSKLLRDVRNYIEQLNQSKIGSVEFFTESTYKDSKGETRPCYFVTKKGCEFIAHKLTGVKGAGFTAKYINRFHEMEDVIQTQLPSGNNLIALAVIEAQKMLEQKDRQIEKMTPKAEFFDAVADSKTAISMNEVAKVLSIKGYGRNNIFEFLRNEGILDRFNVPYQRYVDSGWFRVIEQKYMKNGEPQVTTKTLVYQKGVDAIRRKILDK